MSRGRHSLAAQSPSSQVRHPYRAAIRTALAALVGALIAFPDIARVLQVQHLPGVALLMAVSMGMTRVMALPNVEQWLERFAPWLASEPPATTTDDTSDTGDTSAPTNDER